MLSIISMYTTTIPVSFPCCSTVLESICLANPRTLQWIDWCSGVGDRTPISMNKNVKFWLTALRGLDWLSWRKALHDSWIDVHHQLTNHNIDWDSAQCLTYSTNYFQRLTLESWYTNLEQTPLNRCQQLPAPYKRLIHDGNETDKRTSNGPT